MEHYSPGDVLCVWPRPERSSVDAFLERMGWDGDQIIRVQAEADSVNPLGREVVAATGTLRAFAEVSFSVFDGDQHGKVWLSCPGYLMGFFFY